MRGFACLKRTPPLASRRGGLIRIRILHDSDVFAAFICNLD